MVSNLEIDERAIRRKYRIRVAIFVLCAGFVIVVFSSFYQAIRTLNDLERAERERDQWQKADDVVQALNLREGSFVADIGSGVGYFSLKLAHTVGRRGRVVSVDIQEFPLYVLRARAAIGGVHNVDVTLGAADDPHLSDASIDAVLIANTYHEFTRVTPMLNHVYRSLKPGGRLVIVDRSPRESQRNEPDTASERHDIEPGKVEADLRRQGFKMIRRDDRFTRQPGDDRVWWLIVAQKPLP